MHVCSAACLEVGGVALSCALPGSLLGGSFLGGTGMCISLSGIMAFSGCPNMSPRAGDCNGSAAETKISCDACPVDQGCALNMGLMFWLCGGGRGVGRVAFVLLLSLSFILKTYGTFLSVAPRSSCAIRRNCGGRSSFRRTVSTICKGRRLLCGAGSY